MTETRLQLETRLPAWLRWTLTLGLILLLVSLGVKAYHQYSKPTTLTIAASDEGDTIKILNALAGRLANQKSRVRLKVIPTGDMSESANLFASDKADLAVLRADIGNQGAARTVVVAAQSVALMLLPPGSTIDDFDDLKTKQVGVINGDINKRVVDALAASYAMDRNRFKNVTPEEAKKMIQAKQLQALLVVTPVTERYLSVAREFLGLKPKQKPGIVAIDQADAIASYARYYESYELPKGTLWGSPQVPDEEMETLRVPINIVAQRRLEPELITILTRVLMDARGTLSTEFPILSLIRTPPTDKDAYIPLHPGAATYYEGNEKSFFDRYGDPIFYGTMLTGVLASALAGLWQFLGIGARPVKKGSLTVLASILGRVREADTEEQLAELEDRIDAIVQAELIGEAHSVETGADPGSLNLAVARCEKAIERRRQVLRNGGGETTSAPQPLPARPTLVT
ncbi:hypothetical protein GJW-30_1_00778 [Variibacter gotjawalensis]|uniref:C4-dicarboxylate ABC transporter substrate-binding protein n=1 Tax=Variibacter gotjawalensis TaxID=1333996 RepID=A0A0S3PQN9_9BRAD|nr:TAXI family TRAP transporter solute-binding subunit [Variibacter gotjawalensis]NIK48556.1 TRAP-type uncharacterized transport system substrate-binding protein [Variibacter gotjawalensis]RZS50421.1 TRAP-type uncharacterized transport system substrate-binding protein [Variibacter gotjawalensis]BAT58255.1 hypothetical protein GJW-30_1_00778 [Variibacter gotjawalensis]